MAIFVQKKTILSPISMAMLMQTYPQHSPRSLASRSQTDFLREGYFTVFRNLAGKMRSSSRYLATVRRATFIHMRIKASVIAWSESGAEESSLATRSLMESKIFAEPTALPSS